MPDRGLIKEAGFELISLIEKSMARVDWADFQGLSDMLYKVNRTFITGAGRSGLVAKSFGMRLMHAGLPVFIPGETTTPAASKGDLIVAISCTGETGYTAYLTQRAKELGAKVLVITAEPESNITKKADKVIVIPVEVENIVLRAAVFEHTTSLCLDALFNIISRKIKLDIEAFRRRHANLE
jgi:6-phospho 3-hexuloisomerase